MICYIKRTIFRFAFNFNDVLFNSRAKYFSGYCPIFLIFYNDGMTIMSIVALCNM